MATTVLAGQHIVSSDTIRDLKRSLPALGSGVSRTAYDLGNGSVLKVGAANGFAGGNATEVAAWQAHEGTEIAQYLAEIIAYDAEDFAWLIMRKVDGTIGNNYAAYQACRAAGFVTMMYGFGFSDLHEGNVGYVEDPMEDSGFRFYVIDYAQNSEECSWIGSNQYPSHCETCCGGCSVHSWRGRSDACCSLARFEPSDCSQFRGCERVTCDVPECGRDADRKIRSIRHQTRDGGHFAGHNGNMVEVWEDAVVCWQHAPIGIATANRAREDAGQGVLLVLCIDGEHILRADTMRNVWERSVKRSCDED